MPRNPEGYGVVLLESERFPRRPAGSLPSGGTPRVVVQVEDVRDAALCRTRHRGKKINGRKRHMVVDTKGLPLMVMVTPADLHDSAAAKEVLFRLRLTHPEITLAWADSAYAGKLVTWAKKHLNLTIKTVSRPKNTSGWVLLPRRWVVERSLAWMMNARRHARDYERLVQHSETLITWAAIAVMTKRLTRTGPTGWSKKPKAPATPPQASPAGDTSQTSSLVVTQLV